MIRTVSTRHVGIGAVRNLGLSHASGRYVMFCDSDDHVEPNWIETLYRAAREHPDSLCNCEYAMAKPSEKIVEPQLLPGLTKSQVIEKKAFFPLLYHGQLMHLWTRIFRADIIRENHLRFRDVSTEGEDMIFLCDYLNYCESFYFIHKCLYYWVDNDAYSVTRGFQAHYFEDMKQIYLARKPHVAPEFLQDFYDYSFVRFLRCPEFVWNAENTESDSEKFRYCEAMFSDPVFQEAVKNASDKVCSAKKRLILMTKNYRLYHAAMKRM